MAAEKQLVVEADDLFLAQRKALQTDWGEWRELEPRETWTAERLVPCEEDGEDGGDLETEAGDEV